MTTKIFVNLPVKDLKRSMDFFTQLGFSFNPQFTDEKAAAMIIGENIYAMLLTEPFFNTFHQKQLADTTKYTEAILAIDIESRDAVDGMIKAAVAAGGSETKEPQDHGWMYSRSFQDVDGHLWEVLYMDKTAMLQEQPQAAAVTES